MNEELVKALRLSISGYFDDAYIYGEELLSRILEDIRTYLANQETAKNEPVGWMMTREDIEGAAFEFSREQVETYWVNRGYTIEPLYLHPQEPKKPMTDEEILEVARDHYNPHQRAEISFAREIEKHHGITED